MNNNLSLFTIDICTRLMQSGFQWIARDEDGYIQAFRVEPSMYSPEDQYWVMTLVEEPEYDKDFLSLKFLSDCFQIVKPREKIKISHLLAIGA